MKNAIARSNAPESERGTVGPMPRRRPTPDRRRALELLASSRDGVTEAMMLAHGFTVEQMIVHAGLASATAERVVAGGRAMEVARVRITEAGRKALAGP